MNYLSIFLLGFMYASVPNLKAQTHTKYKIDPQKMILDDNPVTFLGSERIKVIQEADSVLVYGLNPDDNNMHSASELLEGFYISYKAQKIKEIDKQALQRQILQIQNYDSEGVHELCAFSPQIAFEFCKQQQKLRLLLCFYCNELKFFDSKSKTIGKSFTKTSSDWKLLVNRIVNPNNKRRK